MKFYDLIDQDLLHKHIEDGFVSTQKHPTLPLNIFNYTHKAQYEPRWGDGTIDYCRGLIVSDSGEIVSRPFRKFHNLNTIQIPETMEENLPAVIPTITKKLDGCFHSTTTVNLWGGGTARIGDIVRNRRKIKLIGMDSNGNIVPCEILEWFNNGTKENWYHLRVSNSVSNKSGCRTGNKILVTGNHHVWANNKYTPVSSLKKGDIVLHFVDDIDKRGRHIIESSLLGDGCVYPVHGAFRFTDGHKQKFFSEYINFLLGTGAGKLKSRISGYGTKMWDANSLTLKSLEDIRKKWYPKGIKKVPIDLSWIDDFSIAKWFMDDGSRSNHSSQQDRAAFATNGFKKKDVERLANKLQEMYSVDCTVYDSKGWTIRINAGRNNEIHTFWEAIAPYMHESMNYKLPKEYRNIKKHFVKPGSLITRTTENKILSVKKALKDVRFGYGRIGYDIKTTTGNYFARGVLVHNSLGIHYWYDHQEGIATRGSFTSPQALWATERYNQKKKEIKLKDKYDEVEWPYGTTALFEIIYDANRIVVQYLFEDLVLIGLVDIEKGYEYCPSQLREVGGYNGFRVAPEVSGSMEMLKSANIENDEGFVLTYPIWDKDPIKVKIKMPDYVRLHRIVTGMNPRSIWEFLSAKNPDYDKFFGMPEHFTDWLYSWVDKLNDQFIKIEIDTKAIYKDRPIQTGTDSRQYRAECAAYFKSCNRPDLTGILFLMLDGKDINQAIWKMIEPRGDDKSFRTEE